ncbi:hypothetical protein DXG01_002948 [Tephrocybe rancida]|nr:hypothetical protein DXG01_002948 [Tephrocybe rancida]
MPYQYYARTPAPGVYALGCVFRHHWSLLTPLKTGMLLRTIARPSRTQALTFARILEKKSLDLGDAEVDALRLQLVYNKIVHGIKQIDGFRKRKRAGANFYKSMLSAVQLLPSEVLVMIFKHAVSINVPSRIGWSPFGIPRVCSAWRKAITGCSSFWTELELSPGDLSGDCIGPPAPGPRILDAFESWFNRASRARKLTLLIVFQGPLNGLFDPTGLTQGIVSISPRLTDLLFFTRKNHIFIEPLLNLTGAFPGGIFPVLEKLTIIEEYRYGEPEEELGPPSNITTFGTSPSLSILILPVRPSRVFDGSRLLLPWSQLTRLELVRVVTFRILAKALFQCPQLQSAYVPCIDVESTDPVDFVVPQHPMTFQHLISLSLGLIGAPSSEDDSIFSVLPKIHLPQVETLELHAGPGSRIDHVLFPLMHKFGALTLYVAEIGPLETLGSLKTPSSDRGHYKPLHSKLISFVFAFHADGPDLNEVSKTFGDLYECWLKDSERVRPLETLSLLACDYSPGAPYTAEIQLMFNDIRRRFEGLESPFKGSFDATLIQSAAALVSSMGLKDERPYVAQ